MKRPLAIVILLVGLIVSISQCTIHRSYVYNQKLEDLREQISIGDNIYQAASKIEGRYVATIGPLDPTNSGKELWLHVDFGLKATELETAEYLLNMRFPFSDNSRITSIIIADSNGVIKSIE